MVSTGSVVLVPTALDQDRPHHHHQHHHHYTNSILFVAAGRGHVPHDVVLSSGFLAFAQHAGFLQAVEEVRLTGCHMACHAGAVVTGGHHA
jgi:hypothetical protein